MSLLTCDGFENWATQSDMAARWTNRNLASSGNLAAVAQCTFPAGRFGTGQCMRLYSQASSTGGASSNVYQDIPLIADQTTLFIGFAMNLQIPGLAGVVHVWLLDLNSANNIDIRYTSGPTFYVTRNGTTLCTANRTSLTLTWVYIELAVNISATAGWCELYLDGQMVASYYGTGTSRGTATGNTVANLPSVRSVRLGWSYGGGNQNEAWFDDLYICNAAGTINNDRLGDVRVATLLPSGTGALAQFTRGGTDSGNNWDQVNEANINADTDYVFSNTVGNTDTYAYTDLPAGAVSVKGAVAQFAARRDDAGSRTLRGIVRQGGTNYNTPATANMTASYASAQLPMDVNPATGLAWTVSDVNADEFGVQVVA